MKKKVIIIEIILYLFLILAGLWIGYGCYTNIKSDHKLLTVRFNDIDGLEIGAPVHLMGVTVGDVYDYEINNDKVDVTFRLNKPDIIIPKGSTITIQFTGLVGSKSLEIEPPLNNKHKNVDFVVVEPIRISSFVEMSAKTSESILSGSQNFLKMFGEGTMLKVKQNIRDAQVITKNSLKGTDKAYEVVKNAREIFISALVKINSSLDNYEATSDKILASMNAKDYDEDTKSILRYTKFSIIYFYMNLKESNYKRLLEDFIYAGKSVNRRLDKKNIDFVVKLDVKHLCRRIETINDKLLTATHYITSWTNKITKMNAEDLFKHILNKTNSIKNTTHKIEQSI
ncbi:MAG: MlaD family protein [Cyanobacteriota bacterium]